MNKSHPEHPVYGKREQVQPVSPKKEVKRGTPVKSNSGHSNVKRVGTQRRGY